MARNEEKQQGRLNRLWLEKEREEGRLKDVHVRRPKLSTLNSAVSVKKWIPSIKNEIEYYLQQSQLSHYPERKIAEFQLQIQALEKEYKSFIYKLRVLDPACKDKPWTPRAYRKRRADIQDFESIAKNPRPAESGGGSSQEGGGARSLTGCFRSSAAGEERLRSVGPTNPASKTSEAVCEVQDQPLSFDRTRLAVATAAFRGPSVQLSSSQTLARLLQSGLPNLNNCPSRQTVASQSRNTENNEVALKHLDVGQKCSVQENKSDCEATQIPTKSSNTGTTEERAGHVLGLDCYSSSDEDCDT
ncbi:uncharacterized protein si:dkey-86e18.1 [Mugil cephalus]|uniref:uncharacterized protein si:dkey-86e18.1 n=1 Tax=Mugil cephalus TaxID=48193 RepID=UPI001FB82FF4|nr:uncharacterized protein si:dkey-86e18.1 [Mugil cephalus]